MYYIMLWVYLQSIKSSEMYVKAVTGSFNAHIYHSNVCYKQEVKAQLCCRRRRCQPTRQHQPPGSGFMCPHHDQMVMQSLPTTTSRHYLLYFSFYKSMFCYFKALQLKACLDRKMWQILPLPLKSMHSQVLKRSYRMIDLWTLTIITAAHKTSGARSAKSEASVCLWIEGGDNVVLWICTDLISQHSVQSPCVVWSGSFLEKAINQHTRRFISWLILHQWQQWLKYCCQVALGVLAAHSPTNPFAAADAS